MGNAIYRFSDSLGNVQSDTQTTLNKSYNTSTVYGDYVYNLTLRTTPSNSFEISRMDIFGEDFTVLANVTYLSNFRTLGITIYTDIIYVTLRAQGSTILKIYRYDLLGNYIDLHDVDGFSYYNSNICVTENRIHLIDMSGNPTDTVYLCEIDTVTWSLSQVTITAASLGLTYISADLSMFYIKNGILYCCINEKANGTGIWGLQLYLAKRIIGTTDYTITLLGTSESTEAINPPAFGVYVYNTYVYYVYHVNYSETLWIFRSLLDGTGFEYVNYYDYVGVPNNSFKMIGQGEGIYILMPGTDYESLSLFKYSIPQNSWEYVDIFGNDSNGFMYKTLMYYSPYILFTYNRYISGTEYVYVCMITDTFKKRIRNLRHYTGSAWVRDRAVRYKDNAGDWKRVNL